MIDQGALMEKASLGARFKEVMPDIIAGLDPIERQYADELLNCHDSVARDNLWRAVQVTRKLKAHFGSIVSNGTMASHQLAELRRLGQ
jgi:hypothetical protein